MLINVRLLTEVMPREVFGAVNLLIGIVALGRNLFCLPFFQAMLRYYPEIALRDEVVMLRRIVFRDLGLSTLFLAGVIVLIGVPCSWGHSRSLLLVPLLIGLLVVENLCGIEINLLTASRRQRSFSVIRASEACLRPFAAILMIHGFGPTLAAMLLGYLMAEVVVYAGLFLFGVDRIGVDFRPGSLQLVTPESRELRKRIWLFALPLVPIAILDWISNVGDRYLIGGLIGLGSAGTYIAAYGLVGHPFFMSQGLLELLFRPIYFEAVASGDRQRIRRTFRNLFASATILCFLGVGAVAVLSDTIARICLAGPYRGAARLLPWIAVGNALLTLCFVFEKAFHAWHRTGYCLLVRCVGSIMSFAVGVPMILLWGIEGAAWAVPIYYGAQLALSFGIYRFEARN